MFTSAPSPTVPPDIEATYTNAERWYPSQRRIQDFLKGGVRIRDGPRREELTLVLISEAGGLGVQPPRSYGIFAFV